MNFELWRRSARTALLALLAAALSPTVALAHNIALPLKCALPQSKQIVGSPRETNSTEGGRKFFSYLFGEQKAIWTSPLRIHRSDAKWIVPFAALTLVAISTDSLVSAETKESRARIKDSREISRLGSEYVTFSTAGVFYLIGRFSHDDRLKETGMLSLKALINSSIVVTGLKYSLGRERPESGKGLGHFFQGGKSFPSGHAMTAWAFASVVAEQYRDKPLIRYGAYAAASLVGLSRFTGRNHFPSDVLVGSALGYLIGRYTIRHYGKARGKHYLPVVQPYINPASRSYGAAATYSF